MCHDFQSHFRPGASSYGYTRKMRLDQKDRNLGVEIRLIYLPYQIEKRHGSKDYL